jgi:putative intracellular protease/amidase
MKARVIFLGLMMIISVSHAEIQNTFLSQRGKVLIVLSSQAQLGKSEIKTGVWLPDATHPFFALQNAGYDVDYASPKGGAVPIEIKSDPRNLNAMNLGDVLTRGFMLDEKTANKLSNTLKLSEVDAKIYSGVLIAGGMAAMYDLPENLDLHRVLKDFWAQNKVISAIHYGVYGLLKMTTASGREVLRGVELTAVSREEEQKWAELMGWDIALLTPKGFLQDLIKKEKAGYKSGPSFASFIYYGAQKHFITAQQSFSGLELGVQLAKSMEKALRPYVPRSERFIRIKEVRR